MCVCGGCWSTIWSVQPRQAVHCWHCKTRRHPVTFNLFSRPVLQSRLWQWQKLSLQWRKQVLYLCLFIVGWGIVFSVQGDKIEKGGYMFPSVCKISLRKCVCYYFNLKTWWAFNIKHYLMFFFSGGQISWWLVDWFLFFVADRTFTTPPQVDENTTSLSFQLWLASVTERINQTMHYQFDGELVISFVSELKWHC